MLPLQHAIQSAFKPKCFADFPYSSQRAYDTLCAVRDGKRLIDPCTNSSGKKGFAIHGPNGTGKSELGKLLMPNLEASPHFPATSQAGLSWNSACVHSQKVTNANSIQLVQGISHRNLCFGNSSAKGWRYEIIDEAGQLTMHAQGALKAAMDDAFCTIFVFITNDWANFDSGLKSRCYEVQLGFSFAQALFQRGQNMLTAAGATLNAARNQRLHDAARISGGDLRDFVPLIHQLYGEILDGTI